MRNDAVLRIMLVSSIDNFLSSAIHCSDPSYDLYIAKLASLPAFERVGTLFESDTKFKQVNHVTILPILLRTPDRSLKSLVSPLILIRDFQAIFRVLNRVRPNIVICFYVLDAFPLVVLKKVFGYSIHVVAVGGDINLNRRLRHRLMRRFIYLGSNGLFAFSEPLKNEMAKECDCEVRVIPPIGTDPSFFRPMGLKVPLREKWKIKKEDLVILTVCSLDKNKAVDVLIRAVTLLRSYRRHEVRLLVAGEAREEGYLASLQELIRELGIGENVIFLGFRSATELLELYNLADIFALASYSEGYPRALLEAMACGCVSLCTNVGDVARIVQDGYNGFILQKHSPEDIAQNIQRITRLTLDEVRLIGDRARNVIIEKLDQRRLGKQLIKMVICSDVR